MPELCRWKSSNFHFAQFCAELATLNNHPSLLLFSSTKEVWKRVQNYRHSNATRGSSAVDFLFSYSITRWLHLSGLILWHMIYLQWAWILVSADKWVCNCNYALPHAIKCHTRCLKIFFCHYFYAFNRTKKLGLRS